VIYVSFTQRYAYYSDESKLGRR